MITVKYFSYMHPARTSELDIPPGTTAEAVFPMLAELCGLSVEELLAQHTLVIDNARLESGVVIGAENRNIRILPLPVGG